MAHPETQARTHGKLLGLLIDVRIRKSNLTMKNFEFSIIASGLDPESDDFESCFYDAGCDDATISFQRGHIIIDFARDADTMENAISSAIENVEVTGARVERVEPDPLVSLSEIAARSGMSRAAMSLYSKGKRGKNFPAPVAKVTSDSPLWDWAGVARWLFGKKKISKETALEAQTIKKMNMTIKDNQNAA